MSQTTKIIIVIAVLAVIGVIAWYVYSKKKKESKAETTEPATTGTTKGGTSDAAKGVNLGGVILQDVSKSGLF